MVHAFLAAVMVLAVPERVSVSGSGAEVGSGSYRPAITADGRFVAFESYASELVPGDTNGCGDVFVHDRCTGATTRVSVDTLGRQGNLSSGSPSISDDGRFVVFVSIATNLVPNDHNAKSDVFLHDRRTGETQRISRPEGYLACNLTPQPTISGDGNTIAFESVHSAWGILVYERATKSLRRPRLTEPPWADWCKSPSLSGDGRLMAFVRTWPGRHIRVIDFENGMATLVSATPTGTPANDRSARPALSRDGQFVAFESRATDLVPDDRNGKTDVFLRDLRLRTTVRVSVSSAGVEGNGPSIQPRLSADGRFVVFSSLARNLVADDRNGAWDVFIHDLANRTTRRVNVSDDGREADGPGLAPDVSGWGDHVTFQSEATNLVPGDGNSWPDVFVGGDHPRLEVEASAPGPALRLFLRSASDATLPYQLAASLGCEPPIRFGSRVLHLAGDSLLLASLRLPGFTGILDAQGRAVANVSLPLELWGQGLLLAYLTMHPGAPYYVRGISNVVRVSTR